MQNTKADRPASARNLTAVVEHPPRSPDDHETTLVVQLLFRINSTVKDETFDNAEELRAEWQKVLGKDTTGGGESRKKKAEAPLPGAITLNTDQVYHLEFSLPSEESTDKAPDKQMSKFYIDIISMEYMAKVFYGYKSESAVRTAQYEETQPKLFRYLRQNGYTFALIEVPFDVWMTASVIRRLEAFTLDVDLYESPDRLGPRAKADLKNPRKIALPDFAVIPLSVGGEKELRQMRQDEENQEGIKRIAIAANELFNRFLVSVPDWSRKDVNPLVPEVTLVLSSETPNSEASPPKTPPKGNQTQSKKVANANVKEEQLAAKRKAEANKTPTVKFQAKTSQLFLQGSSIVTRGLISPKVGPLTNEKIELLSTIHDGVFHLAVKNSDLFNLGQKIHLCPLTISIISVEGLPTLPLDYEQLKGTCKPVYVEFDRFGLGRFKTSGKEHQKNIPWNEPVVTFMHQFDPELLKEFLTGPPLELQLHDRERKDGVCQNAYGVAMLDLYPFYAFALKEMEFQLPVEPLNLDRTNWKLSEYQTIDLMNKDNHADTSHAAEKGKGANKLAVNPTAKTPDTTDSKRKKVKEDVPPAPKIVKPHAEGRYQDANTVLRVRVSTVFPLGGLINSSPPTGSTPFGRCVLVFPHEALTNRIVQNICRYVEHWNADCLNLTKDHKIEMAILNDLLMYPPTFTDITPKAPNSAQRRPSVAFERSNVLTGFHVSDGEVHILVVEGLCQSGMENFEAFLSSELTSVNLSNCSILWDSSLRFSSRLYSKFGCVLFTVQLFCSLECLLNEPHVKLGKGYWKEIKQTVRQLWEVAYSAKVPRVLHKRNLFPTTDLLKVLAFVTGQLAVNL